MMLPLRSVKLLDTTMRDGEQTPGLFFAPDQKVQFAQRLEEAGLDIIDVGFPASSEVERDAVAAVSRTLKSAECAALARLLPQDIEIAAAALEGASRSRVILFAASSPFTLAVMHGAASDTEDTIVASIRRAGVLVDSVQVTLVDAWRAEPALVTRLACVSADAGAHAVVLADTVGCAVPEEIVALVATVRSALPTQVDLGVHCHNDLGLATANTLAGVAAGATLCEVTIAGIGERAGNAALEEVATALATKPEIYRACTAFDRRSSQALYRLLAEYTGHQAQPNKAIIGANAFKHCSGIHQRGLLKDRESFEWLRAEDVGREGGQIELGKLSGSAGIRTVIRRRFPDLADPVPDALLTKVKHHLALHGTISMETLDTYVHDVMGERKTP